MKPIKLFTIAFLFIGIITNAQYATTLNFNGTNGETPYANVVISGSTMYGMTSAGGANSAGCIFSIATDGIGYTDLYDFASSTGKTPHGSLILSGSTLYGVTNSGGTNSDGVIFSISTSGTSYTVLHNFNGTTGSHPMGSLFLSGSTLYGTATSGGAHSDGCLFSISTSGSSYSDVYDFNGTSGSNPEGSLLLSGSTLYGTALTGGANSHGVIFSVSTSGSSYSDLHDFNGTAGSAPHGSLILSGSTLYGLATTGGANSDGCIFSITTGGSSYTDLYDFTGTYGADPLGDLLLSNNVFFGLTSAGGANSDGDIFSVHSDGTEFNDLYDFNGTNGETPYGSLVLSSGVLYGMTTAGGSSSDGLIFNYTICDITASANTSANVSCNGGSTGTISASGSGASSLPFTYSWSGGGTNSTKTGLSAGTYTVTVTDYYGCSATSSATITQPTALSVSPSVTANVSCNGGSNGSVSASSSGGVSPYTYSWSGGGTNSTKTGLAAGTYTITVTDNNGCTASGSATVTQPATLGVSVSSVRNVSCNGGSNGVLWATLSGGTFPYTYSWTGGQTNPVDTGLSTGTYTVTVTDSCGATANASGTITQPSALSLIASVITNIVCDGNNSGVVNASPSGGTDPFTYLWSNDVTGDTASTLLAGTYSVTSTDNNGCMATASVTITQPAFAIRDSIVSTTSACLWGTNGSATVGVKYGTSPYTYLWSPGSETNATASSLSAGSYNVVVTDNNGCTVAASANVDVYPGIKVKALPPFACSGSNDTLNASGATSYAWSTGATTSSIIVSPASVTTYTVTGVDGYGCHDTTKYIVGDCGNSCSNAVILKNMVNDTIQFSDSVMWFSAVNTSNSEVIYLNNLPAAYSDGGINKMVLYSGTCGSLTPIDSVGPLLSSAGAITFFSQGISTGTYLVKVIGDSPFSLIGPIDNLVITAISTNTIVPVNQCALSGCDIVANGDFESYDECPIAYSTILTYPNTSSVYCWYNVNSNTVLNPTPDYDNSCNNISNGGNGLAGLPSNLTGSANNDPTPGNPAGTLTTGGYAGIYDYLNTFNCSDCGAPHGYREYILQPLGAAIVAGAEYNVSFWVQRAVSGNYKVQGDDIGLYISSGCRPGLYATPSPNNFCVTNCDGSAISFPAANIITAASGSCTPALNTPGEWSNITGTYTATGNENCITIGNFNPNDNSDDQTLVAGSPNYGLQSYDYAYYYIDNISVTLGISITASTYSLVCPGTSIVLTASKGWANYKWSTGQTTSSITITPTDCTPVSVTGSNSGGCSQTTTYTPNVLSISISGDNTACGGIVSPVYCSGGDEEEAVSLTLSANTCAQCSPTYTWSTSPASGSDCGEIQISSLGNVAVFEIPLSDATVLQSGFTITATATCGDVSCNQTFVVNGCCDPDYFPPTLTNYTLSDPIPFQVFGRSYSITYSSGNWTFDNFNGSNPLYINGYFNVDNNLTIENSEVYLGPNAIINVDGPYTLTLNNCHLLACNTMWDGIHLLPFSIWGVASINVNNSLIEDAQNAIVSGDENNPITISGSDFNQDYVGVEIQNSTSGTYPLSIESSTFSCGTSAWSGPPSYNWSVGSTQTNLIAPYTNYESEMGIDVDNVHSITIGNNTSAADNNTFENQYFGIYTKQSNTNIYNNTFTSNTACAGCSNPLPTAGGASGIYAIGDPTGTYTVHIGGTATYDPNTFNYNYCGIVARDTLNTSILYNNFQGGAIGVMLFQNQKGTSGTRTSNTISHNSIHNQTFGVYAQENLNTHAVEITYNNIVSSLIGIEVVEPILSNTTPYTITNNYVWSTIYDIYTFGMNESTVSTNTCTVGSIPIADGIYAVSVNSNITNNHITGGGIFFGNGIYMDVASAGDEITCNTIGYFSNDMSFWGPQLNEYIDYNSMSNYTNGLYLASNGNIGTIGTSGHGTNNTWNDGYSSAGGPPWSTNTSNASNLTEFYVNSASGTPGYPLNNAGTHLVTFASGDPDCFSCSSPCIVICCPIFMGHAIIHGDNFYPIYSNATHWMEKYELYSAVLADSTPYLNSLTGVLDSTVKAFQDSVAVSNMGYIYNLSNVLADTNGISWADISTANSLLSSISSPDTVENTYLRVYKVYTAMLSSGLNTLSMAQADTLGVIAPLCVAQYGPAVYTARGLLSNPQDTTLYQSYCTLLGDTNRYFHKPLKKDSNDSNVKAYPNPANTQFNIEILTDQSNQGVDDYFYLYDNMGKLIEKDKLTNSSTIVPLMQVAQGIYYYRITDSNGKALKTDKLLIIR